ncbi:MAG TPA: pyridoxamine 5'-phosphate oxidase family protein [Candidatus Xenobia bacterium]|jgi:hypothetical protein
MSPHEVAEVLNEPLSQGLLRRPLARLAYVGKDGNPWVIPIGFYWNGSEVIVCTAPKAPKVSAMAARPQVALTIDTEGQPPQSLQIRGRVSSLETVDGVPNEYLEASRKGIPGPAFEAFEAQVRALYKQMVRIRITPQWVSLFDFGSGRLPKVLLDLMAQQRKE